MIFVVLSSLWSIAKKASYTPPVHLSFSLWAAVGMHSLFDAGGMGSATSSGKSEEPKESSQIAREYPEAQWNEDLNRALQWQAPPGCPDKGSFINSFRRYLSAEEVTAWPQSFSVYALIESVGGNWRLTLDITSALDSTVFQFDSKTCSTLLEVAAFKSAMAFTPAVRADASQAEAEIEPIVTPTAEPSSPVPTIDEEVVGQRPELPDDSTRNRKRSQLGGSLRLLGRVYTGDLPVTGWGLELGGALEGRLWSVGLDAYYRAPRLIPANFINPDESGFLVDGLGGGVAVCFRPGIGAGIRKVIFPLCAGYEVGVLRGQGVEVAEKSSETAAWLAANLSAELRWFLARHFAIDAGLSAVFPMVRPAFQIVSADDNGYEMVRVGFAGLRARAGIAVPF